MKSSKRIIINTGWMYVKMFLSIIISLYTSRLILQALGVIDYGVYNVVAGVVTMFNFLNASQSTATQRYITFELGKKKDSRVREVFSSSVYNHIVVSVVIFLTVEVIGLWFFDKFINVPLERFNAALIVFHLAAFNFLFSNLTVPYRALIIAHERMEIIAILDTVRLFIKLGAVIYLQHTAFDKLITVGFIFTGISFLFFIIYWFNCWIRYKESHLMFILDWKLFKELFGFGFFSLIGNMSRIGKNQGYAIILNIFFGPVLNAAFGVANQINSQLKGFTRSISVAVNPQLVKRYAGNEVKGMTELLYQSSKFMFYILFVLTTPFLFDAAYILEVWLKNVPKFSEIITKLIVISIIIEVLTHPLYTVLLATGRIKRFLSVVGGLILLNLPISYLFLKMGGNFTLVFIFNIVAEILVLIAHLYFSMKLSKLNIKEYFKKVIWPLVLVTASILFSSYIIHFFIAGMDFFDFFLRSLLVFIISVGIIYFIGFNAKEKDFIQNTIVNKVLNIFKKIKPAAT